MKTRVICLCLALVPIAASIAAAKSVEVTIGGAGTGGTLALATCVNPAPCGVYVNSSVTGICDCLESVSAVGDGTVIAPALAAALNTDAGCQSLGIAAFAVGNVLTVTGPGTWYLYLRHTETIDCGGLGDSWLFMENCTIVGVANGQNCDETGGGAGSGLDFNTVIIPGSFCILNCPAGDGGVVGPGAGNHSPDINGDTRVDLIDFSQFAVVFPSPPMPFDPCLDYNCDGVIDLIDFSLFAAHWTHMGTVPGLCIP